MTISRTLNKKLNDWVYDIDKEEDRFDRINSERRRKYVRDEILKQIEQDLVTIDNEAGIPATYTLNMTYSIWGTK